MQRISIMCRVLIGLAGFTAANPSIAQTSHPVPNPDASGPQAAVPAPLPKGQADVPGGTSHDGVVQPPATTTGATPIIQPRQQGAMPVIPPPGSAGSQSNIQPK